MGDLSSEPSMEEILSSIKRIIAEEGETAPGRSRRSGRAMATPLRDEDEVLELSDPIPADRDPEPVRTPEPARAAAPVPASPVPETAMPAPSPRRAPVVEPIASPEAAQATRGALDQLSRLLVKPDASADGTLEGLVCELLRPMLREWIDAKLPGMVEDMVAAEIARITGHPR